jgi:serine/threonine-protein kinase
LNVGDRVGRYRLVRVLGRGGMGTVWEATHDLTRRTVALKLLDGAARRDRDVRLLREARAAAAVDHPAVVAIHDVVTADDGTPGLVMDLLRGETLREHLDRHGAVSVAEAAGLAAFVASGLGAVHEAGIVHRDLKPENVFLVAGKHGEERVKVLDFGLARGADSASTVTDGAALGTPTYMAPEQSLGRAVDSRADVFSLGVLLYEALSGVRPVEGATAADVTRRWLEDGITPLEAVAPDVPPELSALVSGMLSREPDDRPSLASAHELLGRLGDVVSRPFGPPGTRTVTLDGLTPEAPVAPAAPRRRLFWPTIAIAVVAAIVSVGLLSRSRATDPTARPPIASSSPVAPAMPSARDATSTPSTDPRVPEATAPRPTIAPRPRAAPPASAAPSAPVEPAHRETGGLIVAPPF